MQCQQKGCKSIEVTECIIYDPIENKTYKEYYCPDHCFEHGYCYICGGFFGGIEEFEFNNKSQLCNNCDDMLKTELGEYDEMDDEIDWNEVEIEHGL